MPNVRFYIDAHASGSCVETIENIEEVFVGIELDNLTALAASGSLFIDSITFENLED